MFQFVASGGRGDGGPAGHAGRDAVAISGAAGACRLAEVVGLVDLAIKTADTLPRGLALPERQYDHFVDHRADVGDPQ